MGMTRLHIPPTFEGRKLSPGQRAALLMREGEHWVTLNELAYRQDPDPVRITAIIWHGKYGSILRGPREHIDP